MAVAYVGYKYNDIDEFVDRSMNCTRLEHVLDQQQEGIAKSFLVNLLDIL
jgi:hypothetical protein